MGDCVHFGSAGFIGRPALCADFHEGFDRTGRFWRPDLFSCLHFEFRKQSVDARRAYLVELVASLASAIQMARPERKHVFHPLAAGLFHRQPAGLECAQNIRPSTCAAPRASHACLWFSCGCPEALCWRVCAPIRSLRRTRLGACPWRASRSSAHTCRASFWCIPLCSFHSFPWLAPRCLLL